MHSPWYQTTCNSEWSPILHLGDKSWSPLDGTLARHSSRPPAESNFELHMHALKKEMANHSSVLAWRIPGTGEPDGLPSMGSHRVGHDWSDLAGAAAVSLNFSCGILWVVHAPCPVHFILGLLDLGKSLTEWTELLYTGGKLRIGILQKTDRVVSGAKRSSWSSSGTGTFSWEQMWLFSGLEDPDSDPGSAPLLAVWPWPAHFTSLCLNVLICRMWFRKSAFVFKKIESILMEWEALWHMLVIVEADLTLIAFPSLLGSSGS